MSVHWASCNVGATRPEEAGGYYAWGETEEKSDYSKADYKYYDSKNDSCTHIGDSISGTEYDVAHVKWGGAWRMPTIEDYKELYERCTWERTTYNGVYGQLVTGPSGKSIFLPAAGFRYDKEVSNKDDYGLYWSGTLTTNDNAYSQLSYCESKYWRTDWNRYEGLSVRPVQDRKKVAATDSATSDGPAVILSRRVKGTTGTENVSCGMVYGTMENPVGQGTYVSSGNIEDGSFNILLTGLEDSTTYYYCTYLSLDSVCTYGEVRHFMALGNTPTQGENIDLGLSVQWASNNVGAGSPEESGGYYAWGETEEKDDYTKTAYLYYDSENKKYMDIGTNISGTQYDVAHVKWGGSWRMPTCEEQDELFDKCTWKKAFYKGRIGQLAIGPNGNSIFLPTAGYRSTTGNVTKGTAGYYWSGSLYDDGNAYFLIIDNEIWSRSYKSRQRRYGQSVRPVMGLMKL